MLTPDIAALATEFAMRPIALFLLIIALTFLLEDATAVGLGALGSQMLVDPVLALAALLIGTIVGDLLLHQAGRLAVRFPRVERYVAKSRPLAAAGRSPLLVASARFVPGLRLPAYAGSGAAGMPLATFALIVALTGLLWTPLLYFAGGQVLRLGQGLLPVAMIGLALALAPSLWRRFRAARPGRHTA